MAHQAAMSKSKPKSKTQSQSIFPSGAPRLNVSAFVAAFAGVVAAVPLTFAVAMPMMRSELASVASAGTRSLSAKTAADNLNCSQPTSGGSGGGGQVLGASTTNNGGGSGGGGQGGGNGGGKTVFVSKLIGGDLTSSGSLSYTGPHSVNTVSSTQTETITVQNHNDFDIDNSNHQMASSGDAEVDQNTTGGSATTGDTRNNNSTDLNFNVNN